MNVKTALLLKKILRLAGYALLGTCAALFFAVLFGFAVKLLWNWLMPEMFGLVKISFAQAVGLVVLSRLLVGGWHSGRHEGRHRAEKHDHFHKLIDSEFRCFPEDVRVNRKSFMKFWDEHGKKNFEEYRNRNEEDKA